MGKHRPSTRLAVAATAVQLLAAVLLAPDALAEGRVALVVGNASYVEAPLRNPVNDARAMSALLRKLGFQVITLENASKTRLEQAILAFTGKLGPTTTGLFYYAGHGVQVGGRNYLVPVDADLASEREVRIETTPVHMLLDELSYAANSINLVILDACRNNPFERRFRGSANRGLAAIDAARGTLIAYATAPGSVARDGDGKNGLYTEELLRVLDSPGLKVEEVFKQVRRRVARRTENKQIPWESSSLIGDFVFNYQSPTPSGGSGQRRADVVFWESIEDSHNPAVYRAYLDQFPGGVFAALAKLRIDQLESTIVARAAMSPIATSDAIDPNASAAIPDIQSGKSLVALAPSTPTTAVTTPSLVKNQYQVAMLPAEGQRWCNGVFDPSDMDLDMMRALNFRKEFAAAYYPHGSWNSYGSRLGKGGIWEPDGLRRRPVASRAYEYGKKLQMDAVLMMWYEARGTDCNRVEVHAYLFDIVLEKQYLIDESRDNFSSLSTKLLGRLNEGRKAADAN